MSVLSLFTLSILSLSDMLLICVIYLYMKADRKRLQEKGIKTSNNP